MSASTPIDGVTITAGKANRTVRTFGGGLYCEDSSPTLVDVVLAENATNRGGGGMVVLSHGTRLLTAAARDSPA